MIAHAIQYTNTHMHEEREKKKTYTDLSRHTPTGEYQLNIQWTFMILNEEEEEKKWTVIEPHSKNNNKI